MRSRRPSGPSIGKSLRQVSGKGVIWAAVFVPATLIYLALVIAFVRVTKGASRLFGLAPTIAEAILVDLLVAALPLVVVIAVYLRVLSNRRRLQRRAFIAAHDPHNLVSLPYYPALIYLREGVQLRIVWNADGQVEGGALYPLPQDIALKPFDAAHFIAHGTP